MSFDLDRLGSYALFARVVQLQSFTAAAAQSGIAKSAVSARIRELEKHLGTQLLRRSTRKLALTSDGLRFYEHCAALLETAAAAERAIGDVEGALRGSLRISAPVTLAQLTLAQALAAFSREHPSLELRLSADDRYADVVADGFDLIVRVGRLERGSFVARRLASDRLVVCGAPSYLERVGRPEVPADLVHHNCLHYELVPMQAEWRFRGAEGGYAVPVRGTFSATDGTVLREAAVAGLGLVVLPSFMIARELAAGQLEVLLEKHRRAELGIYAITAGRPIPRRTRTLVDFLAKWLSREDWAMGRAR